MKLFRCKHFIIKLTIIIFVWLVLSLVCYFNVRESRNYFTAFHLHGITKWQNDVKKVDFNKSFPVIKTDVIDKNNLQRELGHDKRDRFNRRKGEILLKLEGRKAHVYGRSINVKEYLPPFEEEIEKVRSYYNLTKSKHTVLDSYYLIESKSLCTITPLLMVLVPSIPTNEIIRNAIRSTYGLIARYTPADLHRRGLEHPAKIAFLLGRSPNKAVDMNVRKEQERYRDIVQADFIDSYYNLTLKVLYGLKWISTYCKDAKYVLKADEDVFVNIQLLLGVLKTYHISAKGSVFGYIHNSSYGLKVLKSGKWGVVDSEYPLRRYPPYAQGTSYTLTGNLVPKIVEISQHLPYLHIEDALITGIIAGKILGANLEELNGNSFWTEQVPDPCEFVRTKRISQTNMKPPLMYRTWQALVSTDSICANSSHLYNQKKTET